MTIQEVVLRIRDAFFGRYLDLRKVCLLKKRGIGVYDPSFCFFNAPFNYGGSKGLGGK